MKNYRAPGPLVDFHTAADHSGTKYCLAAASALLTVGFEMMTHSASWVWDLRCCDVEASRVYSLALDGLHAISTLP